MASSINPGGNRYFLDYSSSQDRASVARSTDINVTLKFPSDNESGILPPGNGVFPGNNSPMMMMLQMMLKLISQFTGGGVGFLGPPLTDPGGPGFIGPPVTEPPNFTEKYPSDNESGEIPPISIEPPPMQTMKYPSDNESGEIPPISIEPPPTHETRKYPSDNESGEIPPHCGTEPPILYETMKYPSDNESANVPPGS